jgi:hypothetical protein
MAMRWRPTPMGETVTTPDPTIVAEKLERARLDNRDKWRTSGIAMLVLLVIGIGVSLIPIVAIGTLLETRRIERDAAPGAPALVRC